MPTALFTAHDDNTGLIEGVDTGIFGAAHGTVSSGNMLLGAATHWAIVVREDIDDKIWYALDDPTLTQNAFDSLHLDWSTVPNPGLTCDLSAASATFVVTGGNAIWKWPLPSAPPNVVLAPPLVQGEVTTGSFMTFLAPELIQAAPTVEGSLVTLNWQIIIGTGPNSGAYSAMNVLRNGAQIASLDPATVTYVDSSGVLSDSLTYEIQGPYSNSTFPLVVSNDETVCVDEFNCDCESVSPYDTLLNMRNRMMIRLGYPNQINNPPPGMASLLNEFLQDAQRIIYKQVQRASKRTERFFRWTMVPGQRYYGLTDNDNCCGAVLDSDKITWVGFEDLNEAWYRLDEGIPPEYYTRASINFGWPTRFEIRSCIEIFPAPQAAYTLWVKGDFGLAPLAADSDRATIDDEAVFLLALGNAKTHYGQKDAQSVMAQAGNYMKGIVAGAHGTRRYIPRSRAENPWTPPRFLPLGNDQA